MGTKHRLSGIERWECTNRDCRRFVIFGFAGETMETARRKLRQACAANDCTCAPVLIDKAYMHASTIAGAARRLGAQPLDKYGRDAMLLR